MLNARILKSTKKDVTIIAPTKVTYQEDFIRFDEMTCYIDLKNKEFYFGVSTTWEYEDGTDSDYETDVLTPIYTFERLANSDNYMDEFVKGSNIWYSIYGGFFENPRVDAPMWQQEQLHMLIDFIYEVYTLLLLAKLLPVEYSKEALVSIESRKKENWLYRQFEEVMNS